MQKCIVNPVEKISITEDKSGYDLLAGIVHSVDIHTFDEVLIVFYGCFLIIPKYRQ